MSGDYFIYIFVSRICGGILNEIDRNKRARDCENNGGQKVCDLDLFSEDEIDTDAEDENVSDNREV